MAGLSSRLITAMGATLATLGVVGAAGLTWGEHALAVPRALGGGIGEFETTGWAGRLIIGPFWLPNQLVVLAAGIVCWCSWLRAVGIGRIPVALPICFCLYGIGHAGVMVYLFSGGGAATLGPGAPLTVLAFAAMLVLFGIECLSVPRSGRSGSPESNRPKPARARRGR
ncbi:hypothetical protein [Tautonia sociabilis]|uniref:Uncharacterized protein n=1 Tax=Tautonia sociabilis TaxID=2080755 RepID=A0A432MJJ8_9BACT|nr:hypothetical protein [Tautonia sociabilis]RUL87355.1 hypothetical protein TsocGM_12555 [Tautonia sociabilis]